MATDKDFEAVDRWLDGVAELSPALEQAIANDEELRDYADAMRQVRVAVRSEAPPRIEDAQFRVFMDGIREGMAPPARWQSNRWWALSSLMAASFLISLSVFYIFWGDPATVRATDVEEVSTELDGATTKWYDSDDGTTTIWVDYSGDDL